MDNTPFHFLLALCIAVVPAISAEPVADSNTETELGEMVTDRPDYTESSEVVGRGVMQIEMGTIFEIDSSAGSKTISFGTPLLRLGLSKKLELRVATDGFVSDRGGGLATRGMADLQVGFKYKVHNESKWLPAFGVIPFVGTPTGAQAFTNGRFDPGVKLLWAKDAPFGFSLSGNLNAERVPGSDGRFVQKTVTLSVGHDLVAGLAGFWEAFAFAPFDNRTGPSWVYDMGVTRMVGRNAQWDATWGHRLNQAGPDWFVQGGFTFRRALSPADR